MKNIISLDLGATKCAAAIVTHDQKTGEFDCIKNTDVKLADTNSLEDLLVQISENLDVRFQEADAVCIGAAGQYDGHTLHHLDGVYAFPMPFAAIAHEQHWPPFAVIHDYDSVVCATFTSYMKNPDNLLRLNRQKENLYNRRVALGIGTGLGLKDGVLMPDGNFWLGKNEAGHIGIINPPLTDSARLKQHQEFMHFLYLNQDKKGRQISFENILTGRGLVHLYQFLYPSNAQITPEFVGEQMRAHKANAALDLLAWYLGLYVGSVQLIFLPEGGVWITGGIVIKHLEIFQQASFNDGIHASPAFQKERGAYALGVMVNPQHALIGAAYYATRKLLNPATSLCAPLP